MKKSNYDKVMTYLSIIEAELNKIAASVGHKSFDEFMAEKKEKELKKVA